MLMFIVRRLLATLPVMAVVAVFVFLLSRFAPGDPAAIMVGEDATPEDLARAAEALHLDRPVHEQFLHWIADLVRGDLGTSIFTQLPVLDLITQRVEPTISLALATIVFSTVIAVPLGTIAAWRARSAIDQSIMVFSVIGFSIPTFVLGYLLIYVFSIQAGVLPVQGFRSITQGFWPFISHIILPTIMLGTSYMVLVTRITRASVLETLGEDYIRTARAKGLTESAVLIRHALRNAAVPITTVIAVGFAFLVSGVVITESVFNIPGIGRLTVEAISKRDYPVIQGIIILISGLYVIINTTTDIIYAYFDPRIRY